MLRENEEMIDFGPSLDRRLVEVLQRCNPVRGFEYSEAWLDLRDFLATVSDGPFVVSTHVPPRQNNQIDRPLGCTYA